MIGGIGAGIAATGYRGFARGRSVSQRSPKPFCIVTEPRLQSEVSGSVDSDSFGTARRIPVGVDGDLRHLIRDRGAVSRIEDYGSPDVGP